MATYGPSMGSHTTANPTAGGSGFKVQLVGQGWVTLDNFIKYAGNNGGKALKRDIAKATRDYLLRYKKLLIMGLLSEGSAVGVAWAPHSPDYHSPTGWLLYRNGNYERALHNLTITQKNYNLSLKFNRGDVLRKSVKGGLSLGQYAALHEVGGKKIPARPLWGPAYEKMGGNKGFRARMKGAIGKRLRVIGVS